VFSDLLPDTLPDRPVPLYRRDGLTLFFTSRDLLHPEDFGKPTEFYESVIFDVWPANEVHSLPVQSTWIRQITYAMSVRDAEGKPLPKIDARDEDRNLALDFMRSFAGSPRLERGKIALFPVPTNRTYRTMSGVNTFVALAVKDPGQRYLFPQLNGSSQLFGSALGLALQEVRNRRLKGVGIPFIPVSGSLGEESSQTSAWEAILQELDARAVRSRLFVVLGGYGLLAQNRDQTYRSFRQAWAEWHHKLDKNENEPVQEPIRLTALIAFAATVGAAVRGRRFALRRIAAMMVISASIAVAVTAFFDWTLPLWPTGLLGMTSIVLKGVVAIAAGIFIDQIITFDTKKALTETD